MIPFASERKGGQDLATHLLNAHDNEEIEIAEVRGSIAADLHGAFAEWELQADTRTKCEKYLFSLSINPDQEQGRLTRAQYADYIDRTEKALGLSGQPRAVIYHVKDGREHCHVVWSRIDTDAGKAVQLSFWKQKTMMVTRRFARDHDLALPKGYDPDRERTGKSKQASQYEMNQQRMTGLTKAERMEAITEAWRQSDSPKAFVAALEELGYVLATGKQPYVLVDINGDTNALPKLIDDKRVRKRDVQAFLNRSFPPDSLPSVDEAKKAAAAHRKMMEAFLVEEDRADKIAELARMQAHRREAVEQKHSDMQARHRQSRRIFGERQAAERDALKTAYRTEVRQIKADRQARKPTGLAAFLGRVTGIELVRRKIHAYQDRKRHQAFLAEKAALKRAQEKRLAVQLRRQKMQALDMARKLRSLTKVEKRERHALEQSFKRNASTRARGSAEHMPKFSIDPPTKTVRKQERDPVRRPSDDMAEAVGARTGFGKPGITDTFDRAAEGKSDDDRGDGSAGGHEPHAAPGKTPRRRRQRRTRTRNRSGGKGRDRSK